MAAENEEKCDVPLIENDEDFVKGTVQPPKYKDVKYTVLFLLHFVVMGWWFVDSFKLVSIHTLFSYFSIDAAQSAIINHVSFSHTTKTMENTT